jgi:hypothetical protein
MKKHVTKQLFKLKPGVEYYFQFKGPMHVGKKIDDAKEPAILADVVDLSTGEFGQIICAKLVRDALNDAYANDTYVGKSFAVELMRVPEKRYNMLKTFIEIEAEEAPKPQAAGARK